MLLQNETRVIKDRSCFICKSIHSNIEKHLSSGDGPSMNSVLLSVLFVLKREALQDLHRTIFFPDK